MTQDSTDPPASDEAASGVSWANVALKPGDEEVAHIDRMERRASPIPGAAQGIRELITRFEICHFKTDRHVERIVESIGRLSLDLDPATIGGHHPKEGASAWQGEGTGRSRQGQEFIWALQMWLADASFAEDDPRGIPRTLVEEVYSALGERDAEKERLVSELLERLLWKFDRQPSLEDLSGIHEQIQRTDICHYSFPTNVQRMIQAIGRLEPMADFEGCGSYDEARRRMAEGHFRDLCAWLRGEGSSLSQQLGDRTPLKEWLAACLAKTLKEHAGLQEAMPLP